MCLWARKMAQWIKVLALQSKFNLWNPHGGGRKPSPTSCPLFFMHTMVCTLINKQCKIICIYKSKNARPGTNKQSPKAAEYNVNAHKITLLY